MKPPAVTANAIDTTKNANTNATADSKFTLPANDG